MLMPKRKKPGPNSASCAAGTATFASPNPLVRNKTKKEALAAANAWHGRRSAEKSGGGADGVVGNVGPAVPGEEGGVAAVKSSPASEHSRGGSATGEPAAPATAGSELAAARKSSRPSPSPLFGSAMAAFNEDSFRTNQSSKRNGRYGGNSLVQFLRTPSSDPVNKTPPPSSGAPIASSICNGGVDSSSTNESSKKNDATTINNVKRNIAIGEAIIIFLLFALSVAAAIFIQGERTSNNSFLEEHFAKVEEFKVEISKSREVESLLRSGIAVLRQPRWETEYMSEVQVTYNIRISQRGDEEVQSREEKNEWMRRIRMLKVKKLLALNDLDEKLVVIGLEGGKEKISVINEERDL